MSVSNIRTPSGHKVLPVASFRGPGNQLIPKNEKVKI